MRPACPTPDSNRSSSPASIHTRTGAATDTDRERERKRGCVQLKRNTCCTCVLYSEQEVAQACQCRWSTMYYIRSDASNTVTYPSSSTTSTSNTRPRPTSKYQPPPRPLSLSSSPASSIPQKRTFESSRENRRGCNSTGVYPR